ncbi:hypothetical protein PilKf_01015 [Pillotina sp. SPG140]
MLFLFLDTAITVLYEWSFTISSKQALVVPETATVLRGDQDRAFCRNRAELVEIVIRKLIGVRVQA